MVICCDAVVLHREKVESLQSVRMGVCCCCFFVFLLSIFCFLLFLFFLCMCVVNVYSARILFKDWQLIGVIFFVDIER